MRVLVAYQSITGNTRKVATAIFEAIGQEKEMKELSQVASLDGYDLVFIGFPVMGYRPSPEATGFLDNQGAGKNVALFMTHASPEDADLIQGCLDACKTAACKTSLKGVFHCQGEMSEQMANFMINSGNPAMVERGKRRLFTLGQPDAARLERAKEWARKMTES
jgi:flavodoxin